MARKKVVIVIVEGVSDEIALEGSLRNLYKNKEVKFSIVRSDITSDKNSKNIKKEVAELVKFEMEKKFLKKENILRVIHITDMDGAYISEDAIIELEKTQGFKYSETQIVASSKKKVIERNKKKSENLNVLSSVSKINACYF